MATKNRLEKTIAGATRIAAAVTVLSAGGALLLLYILLRRASPITLMWWAGIATMLCPTLFLIGLAMGAYGARREIAGIKAGLNEVVNAANKMVDLRGQAATKFGKVNRAGVQSSQQQPAQHQLDLSPLDDGPEFMVDEFQVGGSDGNTGDRRTIQA